MFQDSMGPLLTAAIVIRDKARKHEISCFIVENGEISQIAMSLSTTAMGECTYEVSTEKGEGGTQKQKAYEY